MLRNDVTNTFTTFTFFLHAPRTRGLYNQHWTGRGSGGRTHVTSMLDQVFFSQTTESTNILDQFLQSANGAGTQLSVACRMRVARVPSYASMCLMYIHMQAPALTYGNVPLCNVLSFCPYVLIRSWPHNCDDVIHFVNQFSELIWKWVPGSNLYATVIFLVLCGVWKTLLNNGHHRSSQEMKS